MASATRLNGPTTVKPSSVRMSRIIMATRISSSTRRTRLPVASCNGRPRLVLAVRPPSRAVMAERADLVAARDRQRAMQPFRPPVELRFAFELALDAGADHPDAEARRSGRLDRRSAGLRPLQHQAVGLRAPRSADTRPASSESAPYLAALVASSCSASARVCAVRGSSDRSGPLHDDLVGVAGAIGGKLLVDQPCRGRRPASGSGPAACARATARRCAPRPPRCRT